MGSKERAISFFVGAALSAIVATEIAKYLATPTKAYITKADITKAPDLNFDGVPDIVVEQRGGIKFPFYGIKTKAGGIEYVTASEMVNKNPEPRGYGPEFYKRIESELNE